MNSTNHFLKKGVLFLLLTICIVSCNSNIPFESDFNVSEPRVWIGPEYWSNPMQDWQIANGELECLVSNKNRNVHILTKKLDSTSGDFKMKVSLKLNNKTSSNKNWVGFSVGSQGEFNDYRDNAVFGKGLDVGVTTNGYLFIDELPNQKEPNKEIQNLLLNEIDLVVSGGFKGENYDITVSLLKPNSKIPVSKISKNIEEPKKLIGDLVLVSHFINENKKAGFVNTKSVSFKNWQVSGSKISSHDDYAFGPILFSQYTLSKGILKLTAQMAPVILNDEKVKFQVKDAVTWKTIDEVAIDKDARTATFRIDTWDIKTDVPYRIAYKIDKGENTQKEEFYWEGVIRKDPIDKDEIVVAGFTGNDHLGFPNTDITNRVKIQDPDVLFFSGDQLYEPNGGYGAQRFPIDKAMLDYLRKWYLYGWAYRDLMKDRPTVSITDDHDVYHGNIWGEGGRSIPKEMGQGAKAQDYGGYKMPASWVKMVERTQTSHLPDPFDPTPVEQGIGVYYTDMVYGGISFAILEDRKFKSAPNALLPEAKISNGWALNKDFDMKHDGDVKNASLLGDRQMFFLEHWVSDWNYQAEMKVLLSQTIFANVATLPEEALTGAVIPSLRILNKGEYPPNDRPVADLDSNGWPQTKRDHAVKTIRKGFVFHLAGDQHLGSTIQYGVNNWNDSGFAFCVPSISNHWPRRWYPSQEGLNRKPDMPRYTGDYEDGFGNKMTVHAISNPTFTNKEPSRLYDRATGYGIVRLNKENREITVECWPRNSDPKNNNTQYEGWPITIKQEDNYGRKADGYLPEIKVNGLENPVVQVIDQTNQDIVYTLRINGKTFTPKIFNSSHLYTVKVGASINTAAMPKVFKGLKANSSQKFLEINFDNE